jgi:hypothetical protein
LDLRNLKILGGFLQGWQDTRKDLKITREGRDLTAKRRGAFFLFWTVAQAVWTIRSPGFSDLGAWGTGAGRRGWAGDPRRALTDGEDKAERPDFEEDGGGALVAGPVSVRRRRSSARLATGSGVEGVARRLGAYGGYSLLRRLPRPAGWRGGAWLLRRRRRSADGGAARRGLEHGAAQGLAAGGRARGLGLCPFL